MQLRTSHLHLTPFHHVVSRLKSEAELNYCVKTKRWIQHSPTADKTLNHRGKKNGAVRQNTQ
jgi:hypothetical protein